MSFDALAWASKVRTQHSADKLVLLGLAECANRDTCEAYPSVAALCEFGSLNRKTVIAALDRLAGAGLIQETGRFVGRTSQVKVYILMLNKESQKRDTIPKTGPLKSPVFTRKESQKRDTEPVRDTGSVAKATSPARASKKKFELPDWIPAEAWHGWLDNRKKRPTEHAMNLAVAKLDELRRNGHDPGKVLDQSAFAGWTGLFELKSRQAHNPPADFQEYVRKKYRGQNT